MSKRRSNKSVKRMMVDVVRQEMIEVSGNLSERESLVWFDGPCYICGGNFIWMSKGRISLTASELKGE